jgi:hypothetical protein
MLILWKRASGFSRAEGGAGERTAEGPNEAPETRQIPNPSACLKLPIAGDSAYICSWDED